MKKNDHVLFILHNATRTGAPTALLHFLRWCRLHQPFTFELLLIEGGPLAEDFTRLCAVNFWPHMPNREFQVIVANGLETHELAAHLKINLKRPLLAWVHELSSVIERFSARDFLLQKTADQYLAASLSVKDLLSTVYRIPPALINVAYEGIPIPKGGPTEQAATVRSVRRLLHIPNKATLVLCVGSIVWRKGVDLMVRIAKTLQVKSSDESPHIVWIGAPFSPDYMREVRWDVAALGITNLHFAGPRANPLDYIMAADIFALPSREDPMPLVALEAASLGKPIVCFADSGGCTELVGTDAGIIVPVLDTEAFANALLQLDSDTERRKSLGIKARKKARMRHDIEIVAPQVAMVINQMVASVKIPT